MRHFAVVLTAVFSTLVGTGCGSSAPPVPTAQQIIGTWQVTETTTQVTGPLSTTADTHTYVFSASCSTTPCDVMLNVTPGGPTAFALTYDGKMFDGSRSQTVLCPGTPGIDLDIQDSYEITPTGGTVSDGHYLANRFSGKFIDDVKSTTPREDCPNAHLEQDLVGKRIG